MSYAFNAHRGLVIIPTEVVGPSGSIVLRLALDTGATATMMNVAPLTTVGYDPSLAPERVQVLAHTLPPSASIDGLLGLDFLRGQILQLDLRQGTITLS